MEEGSLHIVVFPWLAFGHMIPFLELSKSLAKRGRHISFLSTPRNILRLPNLPPGLSSSTHRLHSHPCLPPSDNLPNNAEATIDLLPADVQYLVKAFDGLDQPIAKFLEQASPRPDWIIQDFNPHWLPPINAKLHIPCAMLNTFPAYFNAFLYIWTGRRGTAEISRAAHRGTRVDPLPNSSCLPPLRGPAVPLLAARRCFGGVGRAPTVSGWSSDSASSWLYEDAWNWINNC